ncbi:MAG: FAD-dependent oxidoreductase [Candidatus Thermoplasmatota archaeon]|nr:FAD-dependent oxidoreductase [Candidatus Thermoplasmatota archaeon]
MPAKTVQRRLIPTRVPIPSLDPKERAATFREALLPYSREQAMEEARRCIQCARAWCVEACPIAQDCREYLRQIAEGDFEGAAETILQDNPLASCLGRVCYSYCEEACVVKKKGDPVAIRHLKWAALAYGDDGHTYSPSSRSREAVAIVGAGPAGLAAAWYLGQRGFRVTVFEASDRLGGLMTQSIPPYRLPKDVFLQDLVRMEPLDIEFRQGVVVGRDVEVEDLFEDGFRAVFLGLGTHRPRRLGIPGEGLPGVYPGLHFLKGVLRGEGPEITGTVVTIGGGDVAMDCARSVLRLGAKRSIVLYRRTVEEMPASEEEREDATSEGVEFRLLVSPVAFRGEGHVEEVWLQEMELGPPDGSSRRRPVPIEGKMATLPLASVLVAIGQEAELEGFPGVGIRVGRDGTPMGDGDSGATAMEGVFAGGGASVVHAMAAGTRAAEAIVRYLGGDSPRVSEASPGRHS